MPWYLASHRLSTFVREKAPAAIAALVVPVGYESTNGEPQGAEPDEIITIWL